MSYTKKELMGMNKVVLRKVARDAKANMTEVAKLSHEELVDWILENAEDGGKKGKDEEPKRGRGASTRRAKEEEEEPKRGKKEEEDERPRGRRAAPEPDEDDKADERCAGLEEVSSKVDTIGNVMDEVAKAATDNYNELKADIFCIMGLLTELCNRMEKEEILTKISQTKGRSFEDVIKKLEDETMGS